jgi:hypothetical protein
MRYSYTYILKQHKDTKTLTFHDNMKKPITTHLHISTKEHNCHILLSSFSRVAIDNIINASIIASDTAQPNWTDWRGCAQHPPLTKHNTIKYHHYQTEIKCPMHQLVVAVIKFNY